MTHGFTPGPWSWNDDYQFSALVGADGESILWYTRNDDGVHAEPANARLIAAAPEFYEVAPDAADLLAHYAEFIRSVPADDLERHPYLPSVEDAICRLRTALLKATGGEGVDRG